MCCRWRAAEDRGLIGAVGTALVLSHRVCVHLREDLTVMSVEETLTWRDRAAEPDCLSGHAYLSLFQQVYPDRLPGAHLSRADDIPGFMTRHVRNLAEKYGYDPRRGDAVEVVTDPDLIILYQLEQLDLCGPAPDCLFIIRRGFFSSCKDSRYSIATGTDIIATSTPKHDLETFAIREGLQMMPGNVLHVAYADSGSGMSYVPSPCWSCKAEGCAGGRREPEMNKAFNLSS